MCYLTCYPGTIIDSFNTVLQWTWWHSDILVHLSVSQSCRWHSTEFTVTRPIVPDKIEHSANSLDKHLRATDEDWYHGYHTNWTRIE
jgi:hypothetical protein